MAAPVGVTSSPSPSPGRTGQPRSSASTAGPGTGSGPCAACTRPRPSGSGADVHGVDAEVREAERRADDVDDGVERADLVELDLLGRDAVHAPLGLGEAREDGERALAHRAAPARSPRAGRGSRRSGRCP